MQRIPTLLRKLAELSGKTGQRSAIEIDLMLDYTRVLYADLLEWRATVVPVAPPLILNEPTLDEMTAAMEDSEEQPVSPAFVVPPAPEAPKLPPEPISIPKPMPPAGSPRTMRRPIQDLIGINDKYQFISVLFGNDKAAYEDVLNRINGMDREQQAVQWLEAQHWDPNDVVTVSFFSVISQYFGG